MPQLSLLAPTELILNDFWIRLKVIPYGARRLLAEPCVSYDKSLLQIITMCPVIVI